MSRWVTLCLVLLNLFVIRQSVADSPVIDADLHKQLKALAEKAKQIKDFEARFHQEKNTALLKKPIRSSGRVRMLGDQSRWDTDKPYDSVTLINSSTISIYYPLDKALEVYPLDQRLKEFAFSPRPRVDELIEKFKIETLPTREDGREQDKDPGDVLTIRLVPRSEKAREHVKQIVLTLDRQTGLARRFAWVDADEEQTEVTLLKPKINTGLEPSDLELKIPADVEVVYPLGPAGPDPRSGKTANE